ncbi:unnamed protein product, partial [Rotaria sp. Silwood1]
CESTLKSPTFEDVIDEFSREKVYGHIQPK